VTSSSKRRVAPEDRKIKAQFKRVPGMRIGRLVLVSPAGRSSSNKLRWNCRCDCGSTVVVISGQLRTTRSCGCLQREAVAVRRGPGSRPRRAPGPEDTVRRVWSKIDVREPGECWPWKASLRLGYGMFRENKRKISAHRFIYALTYGAIPDGLVVRHACDNPKCCNPRHLQTGTHADNVADRQARQRQARGERGGTTKLSEGQVRTIRQDQRSLRRLATQFGISTTQIAAIKRRESWKHVV
jgi:hypothetical protein